MEESKKIVRTAIVVLILLVAAVGAYYLFIADRGKSPASGESAALEKTGPDAKAAAGPGGGPGLDVTLAQSDDVLRPLAVDLSVNPVFGQWLKSRDLIRKFVAAVDNIAAGQSPRAHADFFSLKGPFRVSQRGGRAFLDPAGYERYNIVADVFDSVSAAGCARLYRDFQKPIDEAYRDLGYSRGQFHQTLMRAIGEILGTPVVETPILLEKKVTTYVMADPRLEGLSAAQKHLLRMGPENLQLIQAKLRDLALALGFSEAQLPQTRTISAAK